MTKLLLLGISIAFLPIFTLSGINAQPPSDRVSVEGISYEYSQWNAPSSKNFKWVPDYYDRHGVWLQEPQKYWFLQFRTKAAETRTRLGALLRRNR